MGIPLLLSIQVGRPRAYGREGADDPMDRPWQTGFFKEPVEGSRWLGQTNLAGDGQADLVNHGGPDKAVLCYAAAHYPGWRSELAKPDLPHGAFG
jgi:MOSC domain-containing protein YiiM